MPELKPFAALRYGSPAGRPADLLAPPYDVIGPEEEVRLRDASPFNAVRLVLPTGGTEGRYEEAARLLAEWRAGGVLAIDEAPSVYVYRQTFALQGRPCTRRGLFAALRLAPYEAGVVLPHERTHSAPRADRLALTLACRAQLSPVFLVGHDPTGALAAAVEELQHESPVLRAPTIDGVTHELWRLPAGRGAEGLCEAYEGEPLLIADGHHRYETALEAARRMPERREAAYVTACIVDRTDPGLSLVPTHRALLGPPRGPATRWNEALADAFECRSLGPLEDTAAEELASRHGDDEILLDESTGCFLLRARPRALRAAGVRRSSERVASVLVDRLVLPHLGLDADAAAAAGMLSYHREIGDCRAAARDHGGAAVLLPALSLDDVWDAVRDGDRLPPKTTYFAPKIPSGLLFRLL